MSDHQDKPTPPVTSQPPAAAAPAQAAQVSEAEAEQDTKEFFDAADRFLELANEINAEVHIATVSDALLYAAARYNAFFCKEMEPGRNPERQMKELKDQFALMLQDNFDEFAKD